LWLQTAQVLGTSNRSAQTHQLGDRPASTKEKEIRMKEIVYHYTSLEVLQKIINSKELRFTKMNTLSDKSEYKYGIQLLKNKLIEYENNNHISNRLNVELLDTFSFRDDLNSISFTDNGDSLAFWNSYYVDKFTPVAIGFMSNEVFSGEFIINQCKYGDPYPLMIKESYEWFRQIFDKKNIIQISKNAEYKQITFQTAHIKQKTFEIEKEWRAVSFGSEKALFGEFDRNGKKIKYFVQQFNIGSLREIIIGPSQQQELNYQKIVLLISNIGLNCRVKKSTIPLEL